MTSKLAEKMNALYERHEQALESYRWMLRGFTYKPGWVFSVSPGGRVDIPTLKIKAQVQNLQTGHPDQIWGVFSFSLEMRGQYFIDFIMKCITQIETHEIREWAKFQGNNVIDPHPERRGLVPFLFREESYKLPVATTASTSEVNVDAMMSFRPTTFHASV